MAEMNTRSTTAVEEPKEDTYREWQLAQKIPRVTGLYVPDVNELEVAPWEQKGGLGAFINLEGTADVTDAYVCEIPPGGQLNPQRHLYEEVIYILKGVGATHIRQQTGKKQSFEWHAGSLFSIPLNASYQHFNGSGSQPVRYIAFTSAPFMMNIFHNLDFIFENDFAFIDRFDSGDENYFTQDATRIGFNKFVMNFIPDISSFVFGDPKRLYGGIKGSTKSGFMELEMAKQVLGPHISTYPVGAHWPAHYHGPGAQLLMFEGEGYDLLWPFDRYDERIKIDLKPGSLWAPADRWFHQHFNTGHVERRQLAVKPWGGTRRSIMTQADKPGLRRETTRRGGTLIEFADEDPEIHKEFEAELAKVGTACAMGDVHPFCTQRSSGSVPPPQWPLGGHFPVGTGG